MNEQRICSRCKTIVQRARKSMLDYPFYCPCCDEHLYWIETLPYKDKENI